MVLELVAAIALLFVVVGMGAYLGARQAIQDYLATTEHDGDTARE